MEDNGDDEWPARRRRGYPFGPWAFPDIDEMMREMEKAFSEQFKEMEKESPRTWSGRRRLRTAARRRR